MSRGPGAVQRADEAEADAQRLDALARLYHGGGGSIERAAAAREYADQLAAEAGLATNLATDAT